MAFRLSAAAAAAALFALPAAAHITLETAQAAPGTTYKAVFRVPHGCGHADTTGITITVPEGATGAQPMAKPGWTIRTVARPDSTEVGQVVFEGGTLPHALYDEFVIRFRTPDAPGKVLPVPVVQSCAGGKVASWTQVPQAGERVSSPAPMLRLVAAQGQPAAETAAGALRIIQPWTRATARPGATAGGYLTIRNTGTEADRLLGATSPAAPTVELHTMSMTNGVMRMRPVDGIDIPAGGEVALEPGGFHIMLVGTKEALRPGASVPLTLRFARAGEVTVNLSVGSAGASAPPSGNGEHHHH